MVYSRVRVVYNSQQELRVMTQSDARVDELTANYREENGN